jgi:predicted RNase H-like HicB family nuclease
MKYTIIIEKGRESGYLAYAPALKGCVTQGKTKAETLKNLKEAMEAYVAALDDNENLKQDSLDIELIQRRKNKSSRPLRDYLATR